MSDFITNAELRIEAERLCDENARLREDMKDLEGYDQMLRDRLNQVAELKVKADSENSKLRELVRIAVKYCDSGTCDGCPILGEDESCPYSDMARELGVEVDE